MKRYFFYILIAGGLFSLNKSVPATSVSATPYFSTTEFLSILSESIHDPCITMNEQYMPTDDPSMIFRHRLVKDGEEDSLIGSLLTAERAKLPVMGKLLYDCTDIASYAFSGPPGNTLNILNTEDGEPFAKKFNVDVSSGGANPWDTQLQTPKNNIPVRTGEWILYLFYIRTLNTSSPNDFGTASFYCQMSSSPWNTIGSLNLSLNTTWKKFYLVTRAGKDYAPGEMIGTFHLAFLQQEVEIGGMLALNLGSGIDPATLPANAVTYEGMEPDAPWRKEAAERIERIRKSTIRITVKDSSDQPIQGTEIGIRMKAHAFGFGTFISDLVLAKNEDAEKYRQHIAEMFNCATTPFYMGGSSDNWGWYGSSTARQEYPGMAKWLAESGIPAKGHVLIWPGWKYMPTFYRTLEDQPEKLESAIDEHLETLVNIGQNHGLYEWDVVNEPYVNHDIMDILGEEILVKWYNKVHAADPHPSLILNEYNIIMGGGRTDYQANLERLIRFLLDQEVPLGGIGMQCHFDELLTGIPDVLDILDRYAVFGLPIQITEYDVAIRDETVKAGYLHDFYTAVFSHPATDKIVMWGFYEQVMWKPLAALVKTDWTYNPAYQAYMDLVFDEWWTDDTDGITNDKGNFATRGFNGTYDISVTIADSSYIISDLHIEADVSIQVRYDGKEINISINEPVE